MLYLSARDVPLLSIDDSYLDYNAVFLAFGLWPNPDGHHAYAIGLLVGISTAHPVCKFPRTHESPQSTAVPVLSYQTVSYTYGVILQRYGCKGCSQHPEFTFSLASIALVQTIPL
jgi:hypothetical protein